MERRPANLSYAEYKELRMELDERCFLKYFSFNSAPIVLALLETVKALERELFHGEENVNPVRASATTIGEPEVHQAELPAVGPPPFAEAPAAIIGEPELPEFHRAVSPGVEPLPLADVPAAIIGEPEVQLAESSGVGLKTEAPAMPYAMCMPRFIREQQHLDPEMLYRGPLLSGLELLSDPQVDHSDVEFINGGSIHNIIDYTYQSQDFEAAYATLLEHSP